MRTFIDTLLASEAFRGDMAAFAERVGLLAIHNSLAQVAIKLTAPGVPDFYQGTELLDFSLVDPDNRRPVDYSRRAQLLDEIEHALRAEGCAATAARLLDARTDGRVKLFLTWRLLEARRSRQALFACGGYGPLEVTGVRRDHAVAFARRHGDDLAVCVVPRLVATLLPDEHAVATGERWGDTSVVVPAFSSGCLRNAVTGEKVCPQRGDGRAIVPLADALRVFPVGVLVSDRRRNG